MSALGQTQAPGLSSSGRQRRWRAVSRAAVAAEDQREQIALLAKLVSGCSLSIISLI